MNALLGDAEQFASFLTRMIALGIDFVALIIVAIAAIRAIIIYLLRWKRRNIMHTVEHVRLGLGMNLVLALEFLIGADILRTAVTPSWTKIGQLGAIIILRSLLEFFLEREIRGISEKEQDEKTQ